MDIQQDIDHSIAVLMNGGLILYPTDTIWAIGCDATNEEAVRAAHRLKKSPSAKNMIVLLAAESHILQYVTQPDVRIFDYIKGVQKPTTVIYEGATGLASGVTNKDGSVGIRVVEDRFCRQLIKQFGKPLVSTSANLSNYPPPGTFADVDTAIKKGVDYIVQYRQQDTKPAGPSSIIKWNQDGSLSILRS